MAFRNIFDPPHQNFDIGRVVRWLLQTLWHKLGRVEEWHEMDATGEPQFLNTWAQNGNPYAPAAFYKDPFGVVHLRGAITPGASPSADVIYIPEEYGTKLGASIDNLKFKTYGILAAGASVDCVITVYTDTASPGDVLIQAARDDGAGAFSTGDIIFLDGVSWRSDYSW